MPIASANFSRSRSRIASNSLGGSKWARCERPVATVHAIEPGVSADARSRGDERFGPLLDLADLAGRHVRRVATAERQRSTPQFTDGAADAPRDDERGDAAEQARQQDAAAVGQRRPPGPAVDAGERNAD